MSDTTVDAVSDALRYEIAQAERREAYARLNYASTLLELREIRERAAELRSQYEPMDAFCRSDEQTRRAILRAIRYVVFGRKE